MWMRIGVLFLMPACSSSPSPVEFTFALHVSMSADITEVRVDGSTQTLEPFGSGSLLKFERVFESYVGFDSSPLITLEFLVNNDVRFRGMSQPGWCEKSCVYDFCPRPEEISSERLEISLRSDFSDSDFDCLECVGGDKYSKSCQ
jgi:hypothetical protein